MSDLVKRLRELETKLPTSSDNWIEARELQLEAATRVEALEAENSKLRRAIGQPSGSGRVVVSPLAHLSQEEQDAASKRHAAALLEMKK